MAKTNLFKQLVANNLTLESAPFPSELGMEAFLMDNPEVLAFGDEEQGYPKVIDCEISLDNCRESAKNADGRGRLDILVQYGPKKFGILELKKSEVGKNALRQVCDYLVKRDDIIEYLRNQTDDLNDIDNKDIEFVGVLVGGSVAEEIKPFIPITKGITADMLAIEGKSAYDKLDAVKSASIYAITVARYRNTLTREMYVMTETHFEAKGKKDFTRYIFNGEVYNKGKLVNAVIRYVVECERKRIGQLPAFDQLEAIFPKKAQGSWGCFTRLEGADEKRYYTTKSLPIELADTKIATCTQWTPDNIAKFIEVAGNYKGAEINIESAE